MAVHKKQLAPVAPLYTPSRWGELFHNIKVDEMLGGGSAGPGKTFVLMMDPIHQVKIEHERCVRASDHEHPLNWGDSKGWSLFLRRTYKDLGQVVANTKKIFPYIDPGARFVEDSAEMGMGWIFSSGFHYQLGHCKDPDSWRQYQGFEFTEICFDELTQYEENQYDEIKARLRTDDPVLIECLKLRACSNPITTQPKDEQVTITNPFWVRERFVDPEPKGNVIFENEMTLDDGSTATRTWMYLPAKLSDNPNKAFVRQYEIQLRSLKPHLRAAYKDGDWYVTVGSHYADEWNPTIHICRPFSIPGHWKRFRSMDWGFKKFGTIGWFAMDEDENIVCEREYNFKGKLVDTVANDIKQIEKQLGIPWKNGRSQILGPADTQLWEQRGTAAKSMAQQFAECGVLWSQADKKSRITNSQRFSARLLDHNAKTSLPGIMFFDTCRQCIKTIPSIPSDPANPECPRDGGEDHWHDMVCVTDNTKVVTPSGERAISELIRGDLVLSTDGCFWPCDGFVRTRRAAPIHRVTFENGEFLDVTADHRMLCSDGVWRRVDQLDATMYAFAPWIQPSLLQPVRSSTADATTEPRAVVTTDGPRTRSEEVDCCTGTSIVSTAEKYRSATTFIMAREGMTTTGSETSQRSQWPSTGRTMGERRSLWSSPEGLRTLSKHRQQRKLGIAATRVEPGIASMPRARFEKSARSAVMRVAISAANRLWTILRRAFGVGAALPVRNATGAHWGSTMNNEYALPAGERSWRTGSRVKSPVHGDALKIVSVVPAGFADVGCIRVPVMGAFVASGVVVSNCYAVAYASHGKAGIAGKAPDDEDDDGPSEEPGSRGRYGYGSPIM